MNKYVEIAFKSRGYTIGINPICESCRQKRADDVDHIYGRGGKRNFENRMYDPKNLIFVCRECHMNKGGWEMKQKWKEIVLGKLLPQYR